jgi:hypothetical protein
MSALRFRLRGAADVSARFDFAWGSGGMSAPFDFPCGERRA